MRRIRITATDIGHAKRRRIRLSKEDVYRPTVIVNRQRLREFWNIYTPICVSAQPGSEFVLTANGQEVGLFRCLDTSPTMFENIPWLPGLNRVRLQNLIFDVPRCHGSLEANLLPDLAPYYGNVDPITKVVFDGGIDPRKIVRCARGRCGAYQLIDSWQSTGRCAVCRTGRSYVEVGEQGYG